MKTKFIIFLVLAALTGTGCFAQGNKKILPFPIYQKKLANGLNVVTVPFNSPGLASFYVVVRAGSRDEVEEGKTGFAHFFEHMMFRGTPKYSPEAYNVELKALGASANANTSLDRTLYYITGNASMLEKMFEVEGDRFQHLKYSEHDFKTEAGAVKGEYTKNSANPFQQLNEKTVSTAFDQHTYKHTTMGFFKDVVDMPNQYDYSLTFFNRFYRPEYSTIIVVGDVKQADVNRYAQKYFGTWKPGNYQPTIASEPPQTETRFAHVKTPGFPPYVSLNYKGPAFSDKTIDLPALNILLRYLFSPTSNLYEKLVVKEQKARSISGFAQLSKDPNLLSIGASVVKAADMQYIKDEMQNALEDAKTTPINAKKLADIKSFLKYSFAMRLDSPDQIATGLSQFVWLNANPESINNYYALFDKVTAQDIMNAAKKYFVPETLTIATIGPDDTGGVK
ncbi:MAG: pitrilysin family protein [Ferruginibacter sp.]